MKPYDDIHFGQWLMAYLNDESKTIMAYLTNEAKTISETANTTGTIAFMFEPSVDTVRLVVRLGLNTTK